MPANVHHWAGESTALKGACQVLSEDLNPASDKNLAYRGVNGIGAWLTGDTNWSLGTAIYDGLHNADGSLKEGGYDYFGAYWQGLYAGTVNTGGGGSGQGASAPPTPTAAVDEYFKNPSLWGY